MKEFSIICCTHRISFFRENLVASLQQDAEAVEIIAVQNTANQYTVPEALNLGLKRAKGRIWIFCHHDIIFPPGWIAEVSKQIQLIEGMDPNWGVIGVMGVGGNGKHVGSIEDPHSRRRLGELPSVVQSLDEVCLIMKSESQIRFDEKLGGFHLYGADVCLQARHHGQTCYAIDASFKHLSAGCVDRGFYRVAEDLKQKWSRVSGSPLVIETTCGVFTLRNQVLAKALAILKIIRRRYVWKMGSLSDLRHV